jgi:glycosyltransferase involved in cell wall biosynthesis
MNLNFENKKSDRKARVLIDDRHRHLRAYGFGRVALSLIMGFRFIEDISLQVAVTDSNEVRASLSDSNPLKDISYISLSDVRDEDFDYCIAVCPPDRFVPLINNTYLYTMLDVNDVPPHWLETCQKAKGIVIATNHNQKAFSRHFDFVQEVPLIVPSSPFNQRRDWRAEGSPKFSFIFVGTHSFRKGFEKLVSVFLKEFRCREAKLTIISSESPADRVCNSILGKIRETQRAGDIEIVTKPMSDAWLARFYARHDCFVTLTRGEGWGYPALEAAAVGLPVICPEGISSWDFLHEKYNFPVSSVVRKIDDIDDPLGENWKSKYGSSGITYIDVSETDARAALRGAFNKRRKLPKMGKASARFVNGAFSFEKFTGNLRRLHERIMERMV